LLVVSGIGEWDLGSVLALFIIVFVSLIAAAIKQAGNRSLRVPAMSSNEGIGTSKAVEENKEEVVSSDYGVMPINSGASASNHNVSEDADNKPDRSSKRRNRRRITRSIDRLIVELHNQGYSAIQIAERLSVSRSTVYRRLRKALEKSSVKH